MKNKILIIIFLSILGIHFTAQSQCYVFANAYPPVICAGEPVNLTSTGGCGFLMLNDFNNGTPGTGWVATTGVNFSNPCGTGPDAVHLWMGNQVPIPRTLTTVPFNVVGACTISFWLKYAFQTGAAGTNCEGPDLADEGISIQYSINGGTNWTDIVYFRPDGVLCPSYPNNVGFTTVLANQPTPFTSWAQYSFPIPAQAQTPSTMFRFRQHVYSGQDFDHWGIDIVEIQCPSSGTTFVWSHGPNVPNPPQVFPMVDTFYVITVTDTINGVGSATDTVYVQVKPVPTATFTTESPICSDQIADIVYTGSGSATAAYNWIWGGGNVISGSGPGPYQVTWPLEGWHYISLDVQQDGCSSLPYYDSVMVHLAPTTVFMGSPTQGCMPLTVQFNDLTSLGSTWYWTLGDGSTSNIQNPVHTYPNPGQYSVGLIVITDDGCDDTLVMQNYIKVFGQPVADFTFSPDIGKVYDPTFIFDADYTYATSVYWSFGDGNESYSFPPVSHTYAGVEGTYTVTFILTNEDGCTDTITKTVQVIDDVLEFPNIITPNNDGKNDNLVITNGDKYPNNNIIIFNRWGKKIFEMTNYDNKWDGGEHPDGTYFYIFRYLDKEYSGSLTILRGK